MSGMRKRFKLPCYQQTGLNCTYYSVIVAAIISRKCHMTPDEKKKFTQYKNMCAKDGSMLRLSTVRFDQYFPRFGVYFNSRKAYINNDDEFISPNEIKSILDLGKVIILNIQNMEFDGREIKHKVSSCGHSICCVGYDSTRLIFRDSNKYSNSFRKTLDIDALQKGYEVLLEAGYDLEKREMAWKRELYIAEMFIADNTKRHVPRKLRRSNRLRKL